MENKERTILILTFIVGLILLFYYVKYMQSYPYFHVYDISPKMMGEKVVVCGVVKDINLRRNVLFFELEEGEAKINVVSFSNSYRDAPLKKGDMICVKGEVKLYKSKLEIISHEISHEKT